MSLKSAASATVGKSQVDIKRFFGVQLKFNVIPPMSPKVNRMFAVDFEKCLKILLILSPFHPHFYPCLTHSCCCTVIAVTRINRSNSLVPT